MTTNRILSQKTLRRIAYWSLGAFITAIPWENAIAIANLGSFTKLLGIFTLLVGVAALLDRGRLTFRAPSLFLVCMLLFVFWGVLSYFWSLNPKATIKGFLTYVQLLAMVWLIWEFSREKQDRLFFLQAFVCGGFIAVGIALFTFFTTLGFREVGGNFNANGFSMVVALGIPMAWRLAFDLRSRFFYWLNILYIPLALFAIIIAASRGGLLTALVGLLVIPLTLPNLKIGYRFGFLLILAIGAGAFYFYLPREFPQLQANIERLSGTSQELSEGTLSGRRIIWSAGLEVFSQSPYIGVGLGNFRFAIEPILGEVVASHNSFLSVLIDLGVVGISLYLLIFLIAILPLSKHSRMRPYYLVIFLALIVGMLPLEIDDNKAVWFILAMLSAERSIVLLGERSPKVTVAAFDDLKLPSSPG